MINLAASTGGLLGALIDPVSWILYFLGTKAKNRVYYFLFASCVSFVKIFIYLIRNKNNVDGNQLGFVFTSTILMTLFFSIFVKKETTNYTGEFDQYTKDRFDNDLWPKLISEAKALNQSQGMALLDALMSLRPPEYNESHYYTYITKKLNRNTVNVENNNKKDKRKSSNKLSKVTADDLIRSSSKNLHAQLKEITKEFSEDSSKYTDLIFGFKNTKARVFIVREHMKHFFGKTSAVMSDEEIESHTIFLNSVFLKTIIFLANYNDEDVEKYFINQYNLDVGAFKEVLAA